MTGMQLAAKIKEDPNLNHDILLIMLTGISNAPSKIIARNAGIKRILAKPVAGYTLKATLADELAQRGVSGVTNYLQPARKRRRRACRATSGSSSPRTTASPPRSSAAC